MADIVGARRPERYAMQNGDDCCSFHTDECEAIDFFRGLDARYAQLTLAEKYRLKLLFARGEIGIALQFFLQPFADNEKDSILIPVTIGVQKRSFIGGQIASV